MEPHLLCPEVTAVQLRDAVEHLATDTAQQLQVAAYQACAERLMHSGVVLPPFNSLENAHDIDAIRWAFGYAKINFYGASYGTLLGQHFLREHGDTVRAIVLDGVVPCPLDQSTEVPREPDGLRRPDTARHRVRALAVVSRLFLVLVV